MTSWTLDDAHERDAHDELSHFRAKFHIPKTAKGEDIVYLCGNSLGLQPKSAKEFLNVELEDWAHHGVEGHFHGTNPWYNYHEFLTKAMARIVGAKPVEVVAMNALTVNLHLMMVSFYRPKGRRKKILIEGGAFPSDQYAVASQAAWHGFDPKDALVTLMPRPGEHTLRKEDILLRIEELGNDLALVMLGGVNYYTGQAFDINAITQAAHQVGSIAGFDLAHAAGNLALRLHEDGPDFAVWCSYKYLNSGPGGVAGCFVHERHAQDTTLPRFAGWWGNDPKTRFEMSHTFTPQDGAAGWQMSNAPVLPMAVMRASLELFEEATMPALRKKSLSLTTYLRNMLEEIAHDHFDIITPQRPESHGCQLSLLTRGDGRALFDALKQAGIICDFRNPNVIRLAPTPMYNTHEDIWRFTQVLREQLTHSHTHTQK